MNKTAEEIKKKIKKTRANLGRISLVGELPPKADAQNALDYIVTVLNQNKNDFSGALKYANRIMTGLNEDIDHMISVVESQAILNIIEIVDKLIVAHDLRKLSEKNPEMQEAFSKIINICGQLSKEIQKPHRNMEHHQNLMKEYRSGYVNALKEASQLRLESIENGFKDIFRKINNLRPENIKDEDDIDLLEDRIVDVESTMNSLKESLESMNMLVRLLKEETPVDLNYLKNIIEKLHSLEDEFKNFKKDPKNANIFAFKRIKDEFKYVSSDIDAIRRSIEEKTGEIPRVPYPTVDSPRLSDDDSESSEEYSTESLDLSDEVPLETSLFKNLEQTSDAVDEVKNLKVHIEKLMKNKSKNPKEIFDSISTLEKKVIELVRLNVANSQVINRYLSISRPSTRASDMYRKLSGANEEMSTLYSDSIPDFLYGIKNKDVLTKKQEVEYAIAEIVEKKLSIKDDLFGGRINLIFNHFSEVLSDDKPKNVDEIEKMKEQAVLLRSSLSDRFFELSDDLNMLNMISALDVAIVQMDGIILSHRIEETRSALTQALRLLNEKSSPAQLKKEITTLQGEIEKNNKTVESTKQGSIQLLKEFNTKILETLIELNRKLPEPKEHSKIKDLIRKSGRLSSSQSPTQSPSLSRLGRSSGKGWVEKGKGEVSREKDKDQPTHLSTPKQSKKE